jgi:hypothetical protein
MACAHSRHHHRSTDRPRRGRLDIGRPRPRSLIMKSIEGAPSPRSGRQTIAPGASLGFRGQLSNRSPLKRAKEKSVGGSALQSRASAQFASQQHTRLVSTENSNPNSRACTQEGKV